MRQLVVVLVALASGVPCLAVPYTASDLVSTADSFVRSVEPSENHGADGAVSVSGSAALNNKGVNNGLLDSFVRFDAADLVAEFDDQFGGPNWAIQSAVLKLTEQAAPKNPVFNFGVGRFEIRWIADDAWLEGTGTNKSPTTDGVAYSDEPALLNPATDSTLGVFTNAGVSGQQSFDLTLGSAFLADLAGGGAVSLFFTAVDPSVGFTFNSQNFGGAAMPRLVITADRAQAIPEPATLALLAVGLAMLWRRRR